MNLQRRNAEPEQGPRVLLDKRIIFGGSWVAITGRVTPREKAKANAACPGFTMSCSSMVNSRCAVRGLCAVSSRPRSARFLAEPLAPVGGGGVRADRPRARQRVPGAPFRLGLLAVALAANSHVPRSGCQRPDRHQPGRAVPEGVGWSVSGSGGSCEVSSTSPGTGPGSDPQLMVRCAAASRDAMAHCRVAPSLKATRSP